MPRTPPKQSKVAQTGNNSGDLLDRLVTDWERERPELDTSGMAVIGRIINLGGKLRSRAGHVLKPFDLHYTDLDVLATLRRVGKPYRLTPTQLGHSVLLTSGAMTAALRRLESKELITRAPDPSDGRVSCVVLSAAGARLINRAIVARFADANEAVEELTPTERQKLADLLRKLSLSITSPS